MASRRRFEKPRRSSDRPSKELGMSILSPEEREKVAEELKHFASSLNLSDDQKEKLHTFLADAREKVQAYKKDNPNASPQDLVNHVAANRSALRQRLVNFLSPEQLTKWDAEVAKAKEFLGHKMAASA
jgi:protein CpxP